MELGFRFAHALELQHFENQLTIPMQWARLLLDRRCLIGTSNNPRDRTSRNCPRDEYDEATAYDSYMNSEPGFRAGPGDSYDAA